MNAAKITRESKSNLALAFVALSRERREDITIFYAFCRVIDDLDPWTGHSAAAGQQHLRLLGTAVASDVYSVRYALPRLHDEGVEEFDAAVTAMRAHLDVLDIAAIQPAIASQFSSIAAVSP